MKKNDFILAVTGCLLILGLYMVKKMRTAPPPIVTAAPAQAPAPRAASEQTAPAPPAPAVGSSRIEATRENPAAPSEKKGLAPIENPFCRTEPQGFLMLPSVFLREFYFSNESWVALPEPLAPCMTEKKTTQIYFSEYDRRYRLPWHPLVRMRAQISETRRFANLGVLEKEMGKTKFNLKPGHEQDSIYMILARMFNNQANNPWIWVKLRKIDLEGAPSYWPLPPPVHVQAKWVARKEFEEFFTKNSKNVVFVDVRSKDEQAQFKLPSQGLVFKSKKKGSHRTLLEPSDFQEKPNGKLLKLGPETVAVVVGKNEYDHNVYNAANFLSLAGASQILLLKNGIEDLGAPNQPKTLLTPPLIDVDELKALKERQKQLLLVDCRNPGHVRVTMPGAVRLLYQEDADDKTVDTDKDGRSEKAEKKEGPEKFDVAAVLKEIQTKKPTQVILFGANGLDSKPNKVKELLGSANVPFQTLKNGFDAWQFQSKYRWISTAVKKARRTGAHPPPQRKMVPNKLGKTTFKANSTPPQPIAPLPLTEDDRKKLQKSGAHVR